MNRTIFIAAIATAVCASSPAAGCERDREPIYKLPGETEKEALIRIDRIAAELALAARMQAERHYAESAPSIYVGQVVSRVEDGAGAIIKPLNAYRGSLPRPSKKLIYVPASLCTGDEISDGEGWRGKPGELVVVFEGLQQTMTRPHGVDSILATSIRSPALSSWIQQFGIAIKVPDTDSE